MDKIYTDPSELHCSPASHKYAEKDKTCFSNGELKLLVKEFNKKSPKKIKATTKKETIKQLLEAYKPICDKHQFCWIRKTLTDGEQINKLEQAFRHKKPESWDSDQNTWLNTYDILYVMKQYELLYKDYVFLGVYPIDFQEHNVYGRCIGDMLCNFNIEEKILNNKKKRFGVVFNTDNSRGSGQHWISLYCNFNKRHKNYGIYFYDSVGNNPPGEVIRFMNQICEQVNKKQFENKSNTIQKQFSNYDCGVYSIIFQTQCLKDVYFDNICERMKKDKEVNQLRNILYRPNILPKKSF